MPRTKDTPVQIVNGTTHTGSTEDTPLFKLADEYGKVNEKCQKLLADPCFARLAEIEGQLKARINKEFHPEQAIEIRGECYTIELGPCARAARKIKNMLAIFKLLGQKKFLTLAKINIGDLEKNIPPEKLAPLLNGGQFIEKRDMKIIKRE